ncbi:MAG: hypothetical protein CVT90_01925 [Candidatus Altiarchaeales archaeon HGW-Altiarchaeales-3]|nr:MAG: hypothetical protein CVT90_01925 [Candidatus Altiarchaeales archaeon HGW-Altiarchaeales-3]
MTEKIATIVNGNFTNITETVLGAGFRNERLKVEVSHDYPLGQMLRGAFGYLFMDMNLKIADTYEADNHSVIYFRDAIPHHFKDDGIIVPFIADKRFINYKCEKCGEVLKYASYKTVINKTRINRNIGGVSQMFREEGIVRKNKFRFKNVLNLKETLNKNPEYLVDYMSAIEYVKEFGINLGRGHLKGMGKMVFDDIKYHTITLKDIKKRSEELANKKVLTLRLMSDTIVNHNGTSVGKVDEKILIGSVKTAMKFFHPEWGITGENKLIRNEDSGFINLVNYDTILNRKMSFMDCKITKRQRRISTEDIIPRGSMFKYEISENMPDGFYEGLAILEMCYGIGKRIEFGKGEILIE